MPWSSQLNSGTIRRLVLTLATGYLTVLGVRQIPYDFDNEWLVLVPALILVLRNCLDRRKSLQR